MVSKYDYNYIYSNLFHIFLYLGDGANIGACSMVLDDVPSYAVAVGVPARYCIIYFNSSIQNDNNISIG